MHWILSFLLLASGPSLELIEDEDEEVISVQEIGFDVSDEDLDAEEE